MKETVSVKAVCLHCVHGVREQDSSPGMHGWRSRLQPMSPGFDSHSQRHMCVEFVVGSLLCSERFFSGYSGFPSPQKPTFLNSNSSWIIVKRFKCLTIIQIELEFIISLGLG